MSQSMKTLHHKGNSYYGQNFTGEWYGKMKPGDKSSLISVLHELGSACCEPTILEDILTQILPTCKNLESQISQSVFMIAQNSISDPAWNSEVFAEVVLKAVN